MPKATGPLYVVHFKRRRLGRTDYSKRLAMLKGGTLRLVVRKSNRSVQAQIVEFFPEGDKVVAGATSRDLKHYGFEGKCNTPSAYLVGLLVGRKAAAAGVKQFTLDLGLHPATKGSVLFAVLKGAVDSGLQTALSEDKLPKQERISGKHLSTEVQTQFAIAVEKIKTTDLQPAKSPAERHSSKSNQAVQHSKPKPAPTMA